MAMTVALALALAMALALALAMALALALAMALALALAMAMKRDNPMTTYQQKKFIARLVAKGYKMGLSTHELAEIFETTVPNIEAHIRKAFYLPKKKIERVYNKADAQETAKVD